MQAQTPCALLWRFGPGDPGYASLQAVARVLGVTLRCVGDADLGAQVGALCAGLPSPPFAPLALPPAAPALIVAGLGVQDGRLELFLDMAKAAGADLPLRAAVTPTSAGWTLLHLLQELTREHEALHHGP